MKLRLRIKWNKDKVIAALHDRRQRGLGLSKSDVRNSDIALRRAISTHFGKHETALVAAGFDPTQASRKPIGHWNEELILQTLRDMHRAGDDLRHNPMKQRSQPLFFAAKQFFGSYVNAVSEAGINYWEMSQVQLSKERAGRATE